MHRLLRTLTGGDRRSIGRSDEAVARVLRQPDLFPQLIEGMGGVEPLVRIRAADAAEKISRQRPELLQHHADSLIDAFGMAADAEVRWHVAQMLPRLWLTTAQRSRTLALLHAYLDDASRIVRVMAMQSLADLALQDPALLPEVRPLIERLAHSGSPAMRARGRKLLKSLRVQP